MIDQILFDIGNVLLRFDFSLAIARITPQCSVPPAGFTPCIEAVKNAYEAGQIPRDQFLREAFELLEYRGSEAAFINAWEEIFEENTPVTRHLPALAQRYPLYLLSNISDIHVDYIRRVYPFFDHFRDAIYSYRVGLAKPDPAIYETTAERLGIAPERTLFIDDLAANITAAAEVGFQTFHYNFREHEALEAFLKQRGVLPAES